ncbi:MAG TPA: hypothetical protein DEB09_01195 [Candidatus Magasanikbacteria bacterium]|nr:hypothetical protein [Candidatus Magasanikbacteria bacterium]
MPWGQLGTDVPPEPVRSVYSTSLMVQNVQNAQDTRSGLVLKCRFTGRDIKYPPGQIAHVNDEVIRLHDGTELRFGFYTQVDVEVK